MSNYSGKGFPSGFPSVMSEPNLTFTSHHRDNTESSDVDTGVIVPTTAGSRSSSSGGIGMSESASSNSIEDQSTKMASGDIPAFNDLMDLFKFAYILQVSLFPQRKCISRKER